VKAIILAAGVGSRLRPITDSKPKTLVEVNGKPMLGYLIDALVSNGVSDIVICTGYRAERIRAFCEQTYPDVSIRFVHNADFESTNNMYSLYLAKEEFTDDLLLMNADLVFLPGVIARMVARDDCAVAVDAGVYVDESMKIALRADGTIRAISKTIPPPDAFGSSIDVYRVTKGSLGVVAEEMRDIIEVHGDRNRWTEVMLDNLFSTGRLLAKPCDIRPEKWFEIDNYDDLARAEVLFNAKISSLKHKQVFFIDRDGTLLSKDAPIEGAAEAVKALTEVGKHVFVLTNNSSKGTQSHLASLASLGLPLTESQILLSTDAFADYCARKDIRRVCWLANEETTCHLQRRGLRFDEDHPQALLLTYDDQLTYAKLRAFIAQVRKGIPFYATHIDMVCPEPDGFVPDIGCYLFMIEKATGRTPARTFGKPSLELVRPTLERLGLTDADAVIIGDRLYTDIAMSKGTALTSVLVFSGETSRGAYEDADIRADVVLPSIGHLVPHIR
jgi:HAD superfamily hydrolase (TIGR01450 family)